MLIELKKRAYFFYVAAAMLLIGLLLCIYYSKANGFLLLHPFHATWLDNFFIVFTCIGDGWLSVIVILLLFVLKKSKTALLLLFAFVLSGLLSAALKNVFCLPRPKLFFEINSISFHHFIDGVTLSNNSSFPSGHTTSAFAMATVFALMQNKKYVHLLLVSLAILAGYSRIYLGQHFLQDVIAGSFLGIGCAMLGYYLIHKRAFLKPWKWKGFSKPNETLPTWN
jgi:membrane-associated phospholipid phosphatase